MIFRNYDWVEEDRNHGVLKCLEMDYHQYRVPSRERYPAAESVKQVSWEQAEKWLSRGYVFAGHICEYCMAEQDKVDFSEYDYVNLIYVHFRSVNKIIPFYAFYKQIGVYD